MRPIIVLAGPPGVGKSTTARAIATRFPRAIHIPVDDLRDMVRSGQVLPGDTWPDELVLQIRLAREAAIGMALTYAGAGFTVVLDDFIDPLGAAEYRDLLQRPEVSAVILLPSQAEALRRLAIRSPGEAGRYIGDAISSIYKAMTPLLPVLIADGWRVLDTSLLGPEDTSRAVLDLAAGT